MFPKKFNFKQRAFVANNSSFYKSLDTTNTAYFEHRVLRFIENHQFVGREGIIITNEIKLLITISAIKLTFGYRDYLFSRVDTIIIYPEDYFSVIGNQQHKGETNPRYKTVVFSLKDFNEGNAIATDNLNLGIHEFTHAMQFGFLSKNSLSALYFKRHYNNLLSFMENKTEQIKIIDSGYLREYAFENQYEFLAVLVEHYFETPLEFEQKLPEIYKCVRKLLNQ